MSRILMGIHFGDGFMYGLYKWMVNGKRKILGHVQFQYLHGKNNLG